MKKNLLKNMTAAIAALFIALLALPQTALAQSKEAYVVENGSTLTFYYDASKVLRSGTKYGIDDKRTDDTKVPAWAGSKLDKNERTTKVVFDSSFKDYRPATTSCWFCICKNLETIEGIENLNTEEVTDMSNMFLGCSSLTSIDVTKFNTAKVTDMRNMFSSCSALTTIYCYDNWKSDVVKESTGMFIGSKNLKGFATYDANRTDVSMANPSSGYFTRKPVAYVVENGSTLTFYYDTKKATRTGTGITIYGIDEKRTDDTDIPAWAGTFGNENVRITKAVFNSSFKNYRPTTTAYWFDHCTKLETIEGMENLNTEEVTDMCYMFSHCESLTSLDISKFKTANVTTMSCMFYGCSTLTSLDLSNFNTANVTTMSYMFRDCKFLKSLDVSNFNTANVKYMNYMFYGCTYLKSLNLSNFNTAKVKNMSNMFFNCEKLTALDVSNFNTEEVTDMTYMFFDCKALTSLDVSKFNTAKVTDMQHIFYGCEALTALDVSKFNTENVISMSFMFRGCKSLTSLNVSNFNTEEVTSMQEMFRGCSSLTSLNLSNFNTAKVKYMSFMFCDCTSLTSLNVSNFNTEEVTDMMAMFYNCSALTTIYCNDDWTKGVVTESEYMFADCTKLKGAVTYNANKTDVTMANPTTGYFTKIGEITPVAYVVEYDGTLTFYYDANKATRTGTVYGIDEKRTDDTDIPAWAGTFKNENVRTTKAVFDSSFKDYKPTTTGSWFRFCTKIATIEGIENLNTEEVTDMRNMFLGCSSLTSIDVTKFNTAKVTRMGRMFENCSSLKALDVSKFNTANVTDMNCMFCDCSSLTSLDVSNFNTANVTYMSYMFSGCKSLTSIDVTNFNTAKVTDMRNMFSACSALTSLNVSKFNTAKVTNMLRMFCDCSALEALDLSNFNTAKVTYMDYMFSGCSSLKSLDVSNFNTEKAVNMCYMFSDCSALTTIYCNDDWTKGVVIKSENMFANCTKIKGAVPFDATKTDVTMANPTTGYFTMKYLGLMIAGEKVTTTNCKDLSIFSEVNGTASYDPATKTLTLKDATIETALNAVYGIENESVDNLTVKLLGTNKIDCNDIAVIFGKNTSIIGPGSLDIVSNYMDGIKLNNNASLEIKDGAKVTVSGNDHGIYGSDSGSESVVVNNASLSAKGNNGSICGLKTFRIKDCTVTKPKDCTFNSSRRAVTVKNTIIVTDWVIITPTASAITLTEADALPAQKQGVYNLQGVRMKDDINNLPAGIYVIDGRKVVKR